ncbi:cyclase family protein [Paludibacterium sp. B53371]|uniref:cyclase family protein n=1 Tax=Paludibacterium sp. B53371 TaxID=2806263 RepID=UPI001C05423E|nr:cyclase family protein [Paludibacterium sp. B53371]
MLIDLSLSLSFDHPLFAEMRITRPGPIDAGHVGTHLDSRLLQPIPLNRSHCAAVLIDVSQAGRDIGVEALRQADIRQNDAIILYTGHMQRFPYTSREYFADHPQLSWEAVEYLIARQPAFIGIDALGLRRGEQPHHEVDSYCEDHGCYVIENLNQLPQLAEALAGRQRFGLRLGWIAHQRSDSLQGFYGVPVHLLAEL